MLFSDSQNWQDLSYSNIDIHAFNPDAFKPSATPSTTTVATSTTTKKSGGFFSGIKKIFGGAPNSVTTTPGSISSTSRVAVTVPSTTTVQPRLGGINTTPITTIKVSVSTTPRVSSIPVSAVTTPKSSVSPTSNQSTPRNPTTRRTTTAAGLVDEWPALPPPGSDPHRGRQTTTHRPSTTRPSTPRVAGNTVKTPVAPGTAGSSVSDEELAAFSESAFNKDTNNVYRYITVDHQGRTQSSMTTDDAPNK